LNGVPMTVRKRLSVFQKVSAAVVLLAVIIGSTLLGFWASGGLGGRDVEPSVLAFPKGRQMATTIAFAIVTAALSVVALAVGAAFYAIVVATRLFVFDFSRPVWSSANSRMFFANFLVPAPTMLGIGGLVAAIGGPVLARLGMAPETAFLVLGVGAFILMQLVYAWLSIWTPLVSRLTRARLSALGVEPASMDQGILMGISDPAKKSITRIGVAWVEEDIGMLWITPDELIYEGDNDEFRVRPEQLLLIERVANAGAVSAYFGNLNIIMTFACEGGDSRRVRLHPESSWTMTGTARESDRLANELERWKSRAPAGTNANPSAPLLVTQAESNT
jgi:hypothetical protein